MKKFILLLICILTLVPLADISSKENKDNQATGENTIKIYCTSNLSSLTSTWVQEYEKINPAVKIQVMSLDEIANLPATDNQVNIVFPYKSIESKLESNWSLIIGRQIVVPIINAENPYVEQLMQDGTSALALKKALESVQLRHWSTIINTTKDTPINILVENSEVVKSGVMDFLGIGRLSVDGVSILEKSDLISMVKKDPYAIGFCQMASLVDPKEQKIQNNILLLPIDKNGNGRLDYMEQIYSDINSFLRGVWIGKYPNSLIKNVYAISSAPPEDQPGKDFLKWVITDGQSYLYQNGFSDLINSERQSQLDKLFPVSPDVNPTQVPHPFPIYIWYILAGIIVASIAINVIYRLKRPGQEFASDEAATLQTAISEDTLIVPKGLYYDKTHTWAFMERDGIVKIGIDDFIPHVTGPLTRIQMRQAGEKIRKGESLLSIIRNGKQLNLYSPLSGTIKEFNTLLVTQPNLINTSPYTDGWVYKVEPSLWINEIQLLSMGERYRKWLSAEFTRLKDFLAAALPVERIEIAHIVLKDGGALKDHVLADLDPKVWEDFQNSFLDQYK